MKAQSPAVELLALHVRQVLQIEPAREHRFHPTRRWRFDLALVEEKVAVEIDGGGFVGGRNPSGAGHGGHSRGQGQRRDMEKTGEALKLGWLVVRCMPEHVKSGVAISWVEAAIRLRRTMGAMPSAAASARW